MSEKEKKANDCVDEKENNDEETREEFDVDEELNDAIKRAEDAQKRVDELTDVCQRLQADFDNYRKRNIEMTKKVKEDAATEIIIKFLPVLDVIDMAISMIKDDGVLSGLMMIQKQLTAIFEENGVVEIKALNEEFNPNFHNAVLCVDDNANAGKVVEVMQKGYIRGDRVIRHSAVKIAK